MNNVYLYDPELAAKKYQKLLERLETRLTDLGLAGKIYRLGPMTRVGEIIREEIRKKAKTITVVGGDALMTEAAGFLATTEIPLGLIPLGEESVSAMALGITLENGCKTLAARRIVRIDLGQTDSGGIFLSNLCIAARNPQIKIDNAITASVEGQADIQITNILCDDYGYRGSAPLPDDGKLNAYILKTESGFLKKEVSQSSIVCQHVELLSGPYQAIADGGLKIQNVKKVFVLPHALSIIVGKERKF